MLVVIGDRESDPPEADELFVEGSQEPTGPKLLVRAERTRNRKVDQEFLWDFMAKQQVAGSLKIRVPARGGLRKARHAWVALRFAEVVLNSPPPAADGGVPQIPIPFPEREGGQGVRSDHW